MAVWRRPIRVALLLFVIGLGATVLFGLRERGETVGAVVVERSDPDAVIQTRGSRIVQADSFGDNLHVVANRQLTYPDGAFKLIDGVEVSVEARDDREGFALRGHEASVDADQTEVTLTGDVQFVSENGLEARTEAATYSQSDGVVRMPHPSSFARDDMQASALGAEYDRTSDRLYLAGDAAVRLLTGGASTAIDADSATIAQTDGFMIFVGRVTIDAGKRRMTAREARVRLVDTASAQVESLELDGDARIAGSRADPGELREMTATTIRLAYHPSGESIDSATLDQNGRVTLYGSDGAIGTSITARAMDVSFSDTGEGLDRLIARDEVTLDVPAADDQPSQRVTADVLEIVAGESGRLERADFEGSVEYRETSGTAGDGGARVARAQRLDTTLGEGLSSLERATFHGTVVFDDGAMEGRGDQATYRVTDNLVELVSVGPEGQTPRVVDRRGSVQAETIQLVFDGPRIDARGRVESVLSQDDPPGADDSGEAAPGDIRRPTLLDGEEPVLVTADTLSYDGPADTATYSGGAHLWQGDTEFRGATIVLDEAAGNLSIDGAGVTRFRVTQINDDTDLPEESLTTGRGAQVRYNDERRQVSYTTAARLTGPQTDLAADQIDVFLQSGGNALDRIAASGTVTLELPGRLASGDTLVYYDSDGRYEMTGKPVRIVEEDENECRETTGRTLTFFVTADEVAVDGQDEARTSTQTGECRRLMRK